MSEVIEPESCNITITESGYVVLDFDGVSPIRLPPKAVNRIGSTMCAKSHEAVEGDL